MISQYRRFESDSDVFLIFKSIMAVDPHSPLQPEGREKLRKQGSFCEVPPRMTLFYIKLENSVSLQTWHYVNSANLRGRVPCYRIL